MSNLLIWTLCCSIALCMEMESYVQAMNANKLRTAFEAGKNVELFGLKTQDLNGKKGLLRRELHNEQWHVELLNEEGAELTGVHKSVKAKNLRPVQSRGEMIKSDFFMLFFMYWILSPLLWVQTLARTGSKYVLPPFMNFMVKTFNIQSTGKKVISFVFNALTMFLVTSIGSGWYMAALIVVAIYVINLLIEIVPKIAKKFMATIGVSERPFNAVMSVLPMIAFIYGVPKLVSYLEQQHFLFANPELKNLPMPDVWYLHTANPNCTNSYDRWVGSETANPKFCDFLMKKSY